MQIKATNPQEYLDQLQEDRKLVMTKLREHILAHLPEGFEETMSYGMISYVVPHSLYPPGYHANPKEPLPFLSIASQKHYIAMYHSGIYGSREVHDWFVEAYPRHCSTKLDMGKSCVRFKKTEQIPYALIAELLGKMTAEEWVKIYEQNIKR